jgi:hypothetical protein
MITLFAVTLIALILFVGIVGIHEIRTTKGRISILRKAIRCVVFCAFCLLITAASISIYYFCSDLWLRVPDARVSIDGRARPDCLVFDRRSEYVVAVPDSVSKRGPVSYMLAQAMTAASCGDRFTLVRASLFHTSKIRWKRVSTADIWITAVFSIQEVCLVLATIQNHLQSLRLRCREAAAQEIKSERSPVFYGYLVT